MSLLPCVLVLRLALPDSAAIDSSRASPDPEILEELLGETGGAELVDELDWRSEHPLELNRAPVSRLLAIPGVCEEDAEAIAAYRKSTGRFLSVGQLQTMPGGSPRLYRVLSPYVTLRSPRDQKQVLVLRSRAVFRRRTGSASADDPPGTWTRLTVRPAGGIEVGGTFEKGANETVRAAFGGGYGIVRSPGGSWEFLLGDFSLRAGEGLVVWNGGMNGKSGMAASAPGKPGSSFLPHRSGASNRFFRGVGFTSEFFAAGGRWRASGFASRRLLTVRVNREGAATSILDPGEAAGGSQSIGGMTLHSGGGRLEYTPNERLFLGFTLLRAGFDRPLLRDDPLRFSGRAFGAQGVDLRLHAGKTTLLAEVAASTSGAVAWVTAVRHSLLPALSLLLVHRSYDPRYDNMMAGGFGEGGSTRNERGSYAGFSFSPHPALILRGYADLFRRPAPEGVVPFGTRGKDFLVTAELRLSRAATIRARASERVTEARLSAADPLGRTIVVASPERKSRYQAGLDFSPERGWEFQTRLEWLRSFPAGDSPSAGLGISHTLRGRLGSFLRFEARVMIFSSETYASRLSPLESDLPGIFGSQTLYGRGARWFCLLSLEPSPLLSIVVKISATEKEEEVVAEGRPVELPASGDLRAGMQMELHI